MEQDAACSFDPMLHGSMAAIIAPLVRRPPRKMDYRGSLDYLLSFADFERSGRFQDRPDVEPVLALLRRLGEGESPAEGPAALRSAASPPMAGAGA